jgi:hypothetical protein
MNKKEQRYMSKKCGHHRCLLTAPFFQSNE